MNLLINFCLVLFVLVAAVMVLVILMQRPKSEGLGAAFGGGVTENIFGAQTTNVLVKFTTWLAGIFFALTFALSVLYAHHSVASSAFRRELMKNQPAPQTSPAPAGAQSSPGTTRGFCSRCGSTLFFRSRQWPGELHVAHANLHGPADRAPQAHAYWNTHVDWVSLDPGDGLKRIDEPARPST